MDADDDREPEELKPSFGEKLKELGNIRISCAGLAFVCGVALAGWFVIAVASLNPYDRHRSSLGLALIAVWFATALAVCLLRMGLWRAVILAGVAVVIACMGWSLSAPSKRELEWISGPTIDALQAYRAAHGKYPKDLATLGVQPPATRFGPWTYRVRADGQQFSLHVGDYGEDLFTGWYDSEDSKWYWDS